MLEGRGLNFDRRWFSERQYRHLLNALKTADGYARVNSFYQTVRDMVDFYRGQQFASGQIVHCVMSDAADGNPGFEEADLIPITRGLLSVILEEEL
jgi:hypothetical protein